AKVPGPLRPMLGIRYRGEYRPLRHALKNLFLQIDGGSWNRRRRSARYNGATVFPQRKKPLSLVADGPLQKACLLFQGLFQDTNKTVSALAPSMGRRVRRYRRRIGRFERQPVPKPIVAQGSGDEHLA